jgi:trimeric autotransporter adhesin
MLIKITVLIFKFFMKKNLLSGGFRSHRNSIRSFIVFSLLVMSAPGFAQVQLVKDLNTTNDAFSGEFGETKEVNGIVYIAANNALWKTGGTQESTVLLKQFRGISSFTAFRGQLFFVAHTSVHGMELWKSDGTAEGTVLVKDIEPGMEGSALESLVVANNYLFMIAATKAYGKEIWRSNGSTGGTFVLRDIIRGPITSNPSSLTAYQNRLYFSASDGLTGQELWSSDGSTAGTNLVKDIRTGKPGSGPGDLTVSGSLLFFQALTDTHGRELWRTDGTVAGTWMVENIRPGTLSSTPAKLVDVFGTLYFYAKEDHTVSNFWKSDGTPDGTDRAFVFEDGSEFGIWNQLRDVASAGTNLYFYRADQLFMYDGSSQYPVEIAALGDFYDDAVSLIVLDDVLYIVEMIYSYDEEPTTQNIYRYWQGSLGGIQSFTNYTTVSLTKTSLGLLFDGPTDDGGIALWKSNGTYASSAPFFDATDFTLGSYPSSLVQLNGNVLFLAGNSPDGPKNLFKMDGTTTEIEQIGTVQPENLAQYGTRVYFAYNGGLWRTNGTTAGTALVRQIDGAVLSNFTDVNGTLFFNVEDSYGTELWKSTGGYASTVRVKDIYPGAMGSNPGSLINFNGTLYFAADHPTYGRSLWKSDGTDVGTTVIRNASFPFTNPRNLVAAQSQVFFIADNPVTGVELYRTDGTSGGTILIKDLRADDNQPYELINPDISDLTVAGNKLYFQGGQTFNPADVWVTDGTTAGTFIVHETTMRVDMLTELNGRMHFAQWVSVAEGVRLYSTDGTPEGTSGYTTARTDRAINPVKMDNVLYFISGGGYSTRGSSSIWRTDGTACGTFNVPGETGYGAYVLKPELVVNKDRRLVFPAFSKPTGEELFKLERSLVPKSPCGTPVAATAEVAAEVLSGQPNKDITTSPNPFADRFTLRVNAPEDKVYQASIINVNGKEMSSLGDLRTNRDYQVGRELRAGMYLIKIKVGNRTEVRRMIKAQ